MSDFTRKSHK